MPTLPNLNDIPNIINKVSQGIDGASRVIDTISKGIDKIGDAMGGEEPREIEPAAESPPVEGASSETTLKYQLDHLIDDLEHLETEHLPLQGRLDNEPCDCIAKAARSLRRHAVETIPIATRQGKEAAIFSNIAQWAQHLIDIGTINHVVSGKYDEEYLNQAGTASNLRKIIEKMFTEASSDCPECDEAQESIREFIEKKRKEQAKI